MDKKKKVLLTGLGSVGQRHARCLRKLYGNDVEIFAYRSRGLEQVISDKMEIEPNVSLAEKYVIKEYRNLDAVLNIGMDAVFVTNPPDLHIETARRAVKAGANVFIEKPLSHDLEGIDVLIAESDASGLVCMVGHQLRYHAITGRIREIISKGMLGRLTSADLIFAEYLPGMHPYEDYRISHAAFEERGGGTILSLNHDIDIACHFFGIPERVFCLGGHYSSLEINTEDTAHILMDISDDSGTMAVHVRLDFLQRPTRREWSITGENGSLYADLGTNILKIDTYSSGRHESFVEDYKDYQRNEMFLSEIKDFFHAIENNKPSPLGLQEARDILKVAFAAKKSLINWEPVNII